MSRVIKVGGLFFDGIDDYIDLPYNFGQPNTITISLLFRTTARLGVLFGQYNAKPPSTPSAGVPVLAIKDDGRLRAELWNGAIGEISTSFRVDNGEWHHALIVGNINVQSLYVDGQLIGSRSGTISQSWWLYCTVGTGYTGPARNFPYSGWFYFNGLIDEVRIYNRALSDSEIKALYEGKDIRDGLVLYLPMDEGEGNALYDRSGYNNHGTIRGATWVVKKAARVLRV